MARSSEFLVALEFRVEGPFPQRCVNTVGMLLRFAGLTWSNVSLQVGWQSCHRALDPVSVLFAKCRTLVSLVLDGCKSRSHMLAPSVFAFWLYFVLLGASWQFRINRALAWIARAS